MAAEEGTRADGPAVGTVAEEAARLMEALASRANSQSYHEEHQHPPAGEATTCALCPICQGIALLRTVSPETIDRLADLAAAASGALRDFAASHAAPGGPPQPRPAREDIAVVDEESP